MNPFTIRRAGAGERDVGLIAPLFDSYRQFYDKPPDLELAAAFIRDRLQASESVIFRVLRKQQHGDPTSELNEERKKMPASYRERKFRSSLASL